MRRVRFIGFLMTFGLALSACTWPMFGFGPNHSGVNPIVTNLKPSNVGTLTLKGTGSLGGGTSPAIANGVVYLSSQNALAAFDQYGGSATCSGSPKSCTPLWTAPAPSFTFFTSPAVVNGVVYVGSNDNKLFAFDAAGGSATCSGTPKTCTPLWTGTTGTQDNTAPTVANGVVYVGDANNKVYAFDAAGGSATCSGMPKTCTPLWTATIGTGNGGNSAGAVANGILYVGGSGTTFARLSAFDAAGGSATCSGMPKTCTPLWTANFGAINTSEASVVNGVVYIVSADGKLYAFDAAGGSATCSGTPKTCTPLWSATIGFFALGPPAVFNGVVYVGDFNNKLFAFDAAGGSTTCSGTPKTCTPLWTATLTPGDSISSGPAIENGILFVGSSDHHAYAFDAAGSTNCAGTPKTCTPLWTATTGGAVNGTPTPAGDAVYVASDKLYAYGLP